jgi:hypothetical protein
MAMTATERARRFRERKAAKTASPADTDDQNTTETISDDTETDTDQETKPETEPDLFPDDAPTQTLAAEPPQPGLRRKRGRPPNSKNKPRGRPSSHTGEEKPDAASRAGAARGDGPKRRMGGKAAMSEAEIGFMARRIFGLHQLAAGMLAAPELAIHENEAKALTEAAVEVVEAFGLADFFQSKWLALASLAGTAGWIYVPRVMAISNRQRREQELRDGARTVDGTATEVHGGMSPGAPAPQGSAPGQYDPYPGAEPNGLAGHA